MSLLALRRNMNNWIKPLMWAILLIFLASCFTMYGSYNMQGNGQTSTQGLFARINGREVSTAEFARTLQQERDMFQNFGGFGASNTVQQQMDLPRRAYERIVEEHAQSAAAEANKVTVSTSEAQADLNRMIEQQVEQLGQGSSAQERAQIRQMLLSAANAEVPARQRQLAAQRLREQLAKDARPVEVKVAHILIKTEGRSDEAARQKAEDMVRQARSGGDFAKLAAANSEDTGSKVQGGLVGWASAMPPSPPTDPKAKPNPEAATSFVPEFTAASLRLRPNEISNPVKSQFGYHVIKALQEREYQPEDAAAKKDPKKRAEAVESYKSAVANQIMDGLMSEQKAKLKIEPYSAWLRGHLEEERASRNPVPTDPKASSLTQRLGPVISAYEEALQKNDPAAGPGLAYKLAQLYQQSNQDQKSLELLQKWSRRSGNADLYFAQGETLERLKRKTDALAVYQEALKRAYNNPSILMQLADKFKTLGRSDLAQQAREKQGKQMAQQAAADKQRQEAMQKMIAEQMAKQKATATATVDPAKGAATPGGATPGTSGSAQPPAQEITVKTGPIDPKTGKPTIISVTPGGAKGSGKGTEKATETPAKP